MTIRDPLRHTGKSVLVTGCASGIGLGVVQRFLGEGARVAGLDLAPAPKTPATSGYVYLMGDAADESEVERAVAETVAAFGSLDVIVCNAGVIGIGPVAGMTFAEWQRVMTVNTNSVFLGSRAAARQMIAQGRGGSIINAASGAGRRGVANLAPYCASKAAIIMFTQALAVELAPHKIRANCYAPGHIETPFWGGIGEGFAKVTGKSPKEIVEGFKATIPWGRFGMPEDVAATVSWLASEDAEFVNGQTVSMNGAEFPS